MANRWKISRGEARGGWPVLLILLAVVLVPTGCVLWFMSEAMRNESLAVRQKLIDSYQDDAGEIREAFAGYLSTKVAELAKASKLPGPEAFAQCVRNGLAEGVVVFNDAGKVEYPASEGEMAAGKEELSEEWQEARRLEFEAGETKKAGLAYATIAKETGEVNEKARALQSQVRCLLKAGSKPLALKILSGELLDEELGSARDVYGRLIRPYAMLLALQLEEDRKGERSEELAGKLAGQLSDYTGQEMPSSQRRFLMRELLEIRPEADMGTILQAEELAAEYLEAKVDQPESLRFLPADVRDLWHLASEDGRIVALLRRDMLWRQMHSAAELDRTRAAGAAFILLPPSGRVEPEPFLTLAAGERFPGWKLAVKLLGQNPFTAAAARRKAGYLWTAGVGISVIALLGIVVAQYLGRQMKLTRLRNDLIATVSHELKTPLASMRVLVDTLVEGRYEDQEQARDYFRLIGKENERLSRLIDNFLTFSRMERNKKAFDFAELDVSEIVAAAVESVSDRFDRNDCKLEVEVGADLPRICGDRDALITVLLNLLDNAYKYSQDEKRIEVRAYSGNGGVCLAVKDNGIGLSRRAIKKIFNRFYQVDQSLARKVGGCGLGLSIVKFIVEAHGGSISVASEGGQGSTFTVKFPVNGTNGSSQAGE